MIKLIVSDLDGTLLDHSRRISASDWTAVKQAFKKGMNSVLHQGGCTRKSRYSWKNFMAVIIRSARMEQPFTKG